MSIVAALMAVGCGKTASTTAASGTLSGEVTSVDLSCGGEPCVK